MSRCPDVPITPTYLIFTTPHHPPHPFTIIFYTRNQENNKPEKEFTLSKPNMFSGIEKMTSLIIAINDSSIYDDRHLIHEDGSILDIVGQTTMRDDDVVKIAVRNRMPIMFFHRKRSGQPYTYIGNAIDGNITDDGITTGSGQMKATFVIHSDCGHVICPPVEEEYFRFKKGIIKALGCADRVINKGSFSTCYIPLM